MTPFVVAITTSEESTPTFFGLKEAVKLNVAPAARAVGTAGKPLTTKFASPESVMFETVTPIFALQVIVFAAVAVLRFAAPKSTGDVQLIGKLTGEPKP